jgi:DedD protein
MAKQTTEEEFNIKRQTRRRLIGAVALVLFVVILLPIVFDSEPAPSTGNDIELRIPDKDKAGEFQPKIDLPELDKMASEVAAASAVTAPAAVSAPVAVLMPAVQQKPLTTVPVTSKPKVEPKPKAESKPASKVKAKPESKPVAKAPAVPKTGWVLQVGAFSKADAAKSLQAKLSKHGYHAYTEKAGSVVRVRVSGYPTREAAEKAQHKLEAQGTHANVVSLE